MSKASISRFGQGAKNDPLSDWLIQSRACDLEALAASVPEGSDHLEEESLTQLDSSSSTVLLLLLHFYAHLLSTLDAHYCSKRSVLHSTLSRAPAEDAFGLPTWS